MSLLRRLAGEQNAEIKVQRVSDAYRDAQRTVLSKLTDSIDVEHVPDGDNHEEFMQFKKDLSTVLDSLLSELRGLADGEDVKLRRALLDEVFGLGPIQPFLEDEDVSEIMVNGPERVFIERGGKISLSEAFFIDDNHVRRIIEKIVAPLGRRIDESSPLVDARLPNGSRVNAVVPPISIDGPSITIRKFRTDPFRAAELVTKGTFSDSAMAFLRSAVEARYNVLVTGGTGSGKTTTLNVLSTFIPHSERIVTIEDAAELNLQQPHVVRLESRPANIENKGTISIRMLVKNSLRMRPDRIVVGECRGEEAFDMLQAMNTGHDGSLTTLHANSPRDVLSRLESMILMAGMDLPVRAIREQISSAVDIIVHQERLRDGSRRALYITELTGMEGDTIQTQDLFTFDHRGFDEAGNVKGEMVPSGILPSRSYKFDISGVALPADIFKSGR